MKPKFKNITLRKIALFSLLFLFLPSFNKVLADSLPFSSGDSIEIEVITSEGSDRSHNDVGPELDYLKYNNIVRPGLCKLSCSSGQMNDQVTYYGVNLSSSQAYFGSNNNSFLGFYPNTASENFSILTTVPNLSQGETSVFAKNSVNSVSSNYLDFEKLAEDPQGPSISFFSPEIGSAGQYITIYGNGFYNSHGTSLVYFKNIENGATTSASFSFPDVCLQSVWSDNQVLIKVPEGLSDGDYKIGMKIRDWNEIESDKIFTASSSSPLLPSLCKISPALGPINSNVSLWGEYFGNNSLAVFSRNKLTSYIAPTSDSQADKISVSVPANSVTGPVGVQRENENSIGNSLNFTVGTCSSNSDCPSNSNYCCLPGTSLAGSCVVSSENCLASTTLNSVFQWDFTTGFATSTNNTDNNYSCASSNICLVDNVCPNSPGLCSPYAGGQTITSSACKNDCSSVEACNGASCFYQEKLNNNIFDRCIIGTENNPQTCSLSKIVNYNLSGIGSITKTATCKSVIINNEEKKYYTISVDNICPDNWTMVSNGLCADTSAECNICSKGTNCQNLNNNTNSLGVCVSERLCSDSYTCQSDYCTKEDSASCQCCCDKNKNDSATGENPACCSPLTCDNTCGSGGDYGLCSGCKISDSASSSDRDSACNCTGTSGKYCQVDDKYTSGACLDCTSLSDETTCREHSASCCWDSNSNVCHGGTSDSSVWGEGSSSIGYCPYYKCDDSDSTICASSTPVISSVGNYSTVTECNKKCSNNCSQLFGSLNFNSCLSGGAGCCWKTSVVPENGIDYTLSGLCGGGSRYTSGIYQGLCKKFECTSNKVCTSTPFGNLETCTSKICQENDPPTPNVSCRVASSTTVNLCNSSLCSSPFNCLTNTSNSTVDTDSCGYCCCDPNAETDVCASINSKLSCFANKGNCTGSSRGLCCGCSADTDCSSTETTGCGSDTCCYSRPEIINTYPVDKASDVCRNSIISINFNQRMMANSIDGNILVLEENNDECSSETYVLTADNSGAIAYNNSIKEKNVWQKIKGMFVNSFVYVAKVFGQEVIASPSSDKIYCVVPGRLEIESVSDNLSTVNFYPTQLLKADSRYFVIVKGDQNLDSSSGVKNYRDIGFNGSGYVAVTGGTRIEVDGSNDIKFNNLYFKNSQIFDFKTLSVNSSGSGICTVNYVEVTPSSYLFNNLENDINENDINPMDDSFNSAHDEDVVFYAKAYSENNQILATSSQYNWTWVWSVDNNQKIDFKTISSWSDSGNKRMIKVLEGVTFGEAKVGAVVNLDAGSFTRDGNETAGSADVYILDCDNPWPSIQPNGTWIPWEDSNLTNTYNSYNYKLYYCRDSGEEGTGDDLPAFSESNIINKGKSLNKVCTNNPATSCNTDNDCQNGGFCLSSFLKETYFFRDAATITGTEDVFTLRYYTADNNGRVEGSSFYQMVYYGNDGDEITAIPNYGYVFDQWSDGNTEATRVDQNVTQNVSVYPIFSRKSYNVNYSVDAGSINYGALNGSTSQLVMHGENGLLVTASPKTGYHFNSWIVNGSLDENDNTSRIETDVTSNLDIKARFLVDVYFKLMYIAEPNGHIVVNGVTGNNMQTVLQGKNGLSVTAVANDGYHFDQWSDGSTENPRTDYNINDDVEVTAKFSRNTYAFSYTAGEGGSITGTLNQSVYLGETGSVVTAVANSGYYFVKWSDEVTTNSRQDIATQNLSVTAIFDRRYTLTYTAGSGGTITGQTTQIINSGGNGTTVTAVPNAGYHFVSWSDGVNATSRTDTNVTSNKSITANFSTYTYTVTYRAGSNGAIRQVGSSTPIPSYTQTVNHGETTSLSFEAVPYSGYAFDKWNDNRTDSPRSDSNVISNIDVTANFIKLYNIVYVAGSNGSITGSTNQSIVPGQNGTSVTAVPNEGYHFVQWNDGNTSATRTDGSSLIGDASYTATFAINTYTVTFVAGTGGKITNGAGAVSNITQTVNYNSNASTTIAIPSTGYKFVNYTNNGGSADVNTNYTEVSVSHVKGNITITANFSLLTYTVHYVAGAGGTISGNDNQMVSYGGATVAVTAVPNTGYHFVSWSDNSTSTTRTDSNVTSDKSYTATFAINTYTFKYTAGAGGKIQMNGLSTATTTINQTVSYGNVGISVWSVSDTGYHFDKWSDGNTNSSRQDYADQNYDVKAEFAINTYDLTYNAGLGGLINGISAQTTQTGISYGSDGQAVTAVPNTGFAFLGWSDGRTDNPRIDTNVTSGVYVTAYFAQRYTLTYYVSGDGGTINGSTTQVVLSGGSGTQVEAIPDSGYQFAGWVDGNGNPIRTDSNVTSNQSYFCKFITDSNYVFNCGDNVIYGGETYPTKQYGTQCWMTKNMNIGTKINASSGGQTNNSIIEKFCYNNNSSYCDSYGGLYQADETVKYTSGAVIQGVCPNGWHVPTKYQFDILADIIDSDINNYCNNTSSYIAKSMAATSGWTSSSAVCSPGNNQNSNNNSGFNIFPSGEYYNGFSGIGSVNRFWTSSLYYSVAYYYYLKNAFPTFNNSYCDQKYSFSVRCLKN